MLEETIFAEKCNGIMKNLEKMGNIHQELITLLSSIWVIHTGFVL